MSKWQNDDILDEALNYIVNNANKMTVCSAQPTTYGEAVNEAASSGYMLADVVISSADFTGPANGDTSGRKITVNQQSSILIDDTGSATHVALVDTGSSGTLLYVTTCTSQSLTSGNNVTIPAWDIELYDAA